MKYHWKSQGTRDEFWLWAMLNVILHCLTGEMSLCPHMPSVKVRNQYSMLYSEPRLSIRGKNGHSLANSTYLLILPPVPPGRRMSRLNTNRTACWQFKGFDPKIYCIGELSDPISSPARGGGGGGLMDQPESSWPARYGQQRRALP